jgi:CheY-like chemotaxis protein
MFLEMGKFVLSAPGYLVERAPDASHALLQIPVFAPELILMDIQMPVMDGIEFTRRLKADPVTQHIIIVAFTAYAMKGDEARMRAAGCDGYITKPIDVMSLRREGALAAGEPARRHRQPAARGILNGSIACTAGLAKRANDRLDPPSFQIVIKSDDVVLTERSQSLPGKTLEHGDVLDCSVWRLSVVGGSSPWCRASRAAGVYPVHRGPDHPAVHRRQVDSGS